VKEGDTVEDYAPESDCGRTQGQILLLIQGVYIKRGKRVPDVREGSPASPNATQSLNTDSPTSRKAPPMMI
jgi:hypothetical protein